MSGINITIGNWTHTTDSPLSFMIIYHLLVSLIYTFIFLFIYILCTINNQNFKYEEIDALKRKLNRREQCMSEIADKIEQFKLE